MARYDPTTWNRFTAQVGEHVLDAYDLEDGSDLCFTLLEMDVVRTDMTVEEAARIVAMHMEQA